MDHCPDCGDLVQELEENGNLAPTTPCKAFTCPACGAILGTVMDDKR